VLIKNPDEMMTLCPCQSGKSLTFCCLPIIEGKQHAKTALELMRSRYSAFALDKRQYLIDSWHTDYKPKLMEIDPSIKWVKLEIIESNSTMVHFRAYSLINDQLSLLEEKSHFERIHNQWFYTTGEQIPVQGYKISRNSSCLCGSGKKFKRCCGKK
jgi:SEC-C motif-containing protein